jgi:hypothetical protein
MLLAVFMKEQATCFGADLFVWWPVQRAQRGVWTVEFFFKEGAIISSSKRWY